MSKQMNMTGRELILYILQNHLEDEPIFENGRIIGFITEEEAALKFGVGTATIQVWVDRGILSGVTICDQLYIPVKANPTLKTGKE
ncbi:MAG: helix-turn-helix domain-containing protein [Ruminococcus sp.]|nr:helix-turn-helix domain-containing protein [Ruminococcus sp.]